MLKKEMEKCANSSIFEGMPSISALFKGMEQGKNDEDILNAIADLNANSASLIAEIRELL